MRQDGCTVVFDVGKTNAKLTLWDARGRFLERHVRRNDEVRASGYRALDAQGLEEWLAATLSEFARSARVSAIIPVAHGAAAALVHDAQLFARADGLRG